MKKIILPLLFVLVLIIFPGQCFADLVATESFSLTIPQTTSLQLISDKTDFGTIQSSEYGVSNKSAHVITLGDGTNNTSHIRTNNPKTVSNKQFKLTFSSNSMNVNVVSQDNIAKLVLTDTNQTEVSINLTDYGQSELPKLGAGEGSSFVVQDYNSLAIPASSNIEFEDQVAALSMKMDLDESTLDVNDTPQTMDFNVVFSIVGIN